MTGDVEIVRYRAEHKQEVARLQTALWGPDPAANARYLEWKYEQNPWAARPRIYLAVRGDEVIGMRGFFESRWEVGAPARCVSIPLADDLAIRASERNTGLATRIMRSGLSDLAESGCEYVLSLSAGMVTTLGSLALGWKSAVRYDLLARRDAAHCRRARIRELALRLPLLWRAAGSPRLLSRSEREPFHRLDAAAPGLRGLRVEKQPRCAEMAQLVAEIGHGGRLRHVRSAEYLAWRFANPMYEYRFLYAYGPEGLDGYLVLSSRVMGGVASRTCICDLEGRSASVRADLLEAVLEAGDLSELAVWASTLPPAERAALTLCGFAPADPRAAARGHPAALVRATRDRAPSEWRLCEQPLLDPASWDLRMLYSMAA
jgi:hypothetical protein